MAKPAQAATQPKATRKGRKSRARKTRTLKNKDEQQQTQQSQPTLSRSQIAYQGFDETSSAYLGAHRTQGKTLENTSIMDVAIWARTSFVNTTQRGSQTERGRTQARKVRGDKKANTNAQSLPAAA